MDGLAAGTKSLLEEKGYKVVDIDTAREVRQASLLRFKKDKMAYKDLIQGDMKEVFPEVVVEDTLAEAEEYDLLIIAGTTAEL
ncbi:MAG: hypothetical protein ACD_25C00185G0001 [uncultured bacterium]|nr:MAG: hypothetical protein ACD_25C00185G0001 [uncultured bacterium]